MLRHSLGGGACMPTAWVVIQVSLCRPTVELFLARGLGRPRLMPKRSDKGVHTRQPCWYGEKFVSLKGWGEVDSLCRPEMCVYCRSKREFFIDNLLFRIHFIIVMIRWTGLAPWECEYHFSGSWTSTFLVTQIEPSMAAMHSLSRRPCKTRT